MAGRAEGKCGEFHPKTDGWEILCTVKGTVFEGIRTRLHVTGVLTFGMHASGGPAGGESRLRDAISKLPSALTRYASWSFSFPICKVGMRSSGREMVRFISDHRKYG